jgi:hypothetical protein
MFKFFKVEALNSIGWGASHAPQPAKNIGDRCQTIALGGFVIPTTIPETIIRWLQAKFSHQKLEHRVIAFLISLRG